MYNHVTKRVKILQCYENIPSLLILPSSIKNEPEDVRQDEVQNYQNIQQRDGFAQFLNVISTNTASCFQLEI